MPALFEIIEEIEKTAPLCLAESWDNPGLMLGRRDKEIKKVLTALDMDTGVAKEAIEIGADLILTHHPMIFHPLKSITEDGGAGECVLMLAKHDIAVYSAHTNLDSAVGGTNDYLAQLYGLENVYAIPPEEDKTTGLMRLGKLKEEKTLENLALHIKQKLDAQNVWYAGDKERKIKKVAICSGGGGKMFGEAVSAGADVYITGDISYSSARDAVEKGICLINAEHYESEKYCGEIFKKILCGFDIEIIHSKTNKNIINYV